MSVIQLMPGDFDKNQWNGVAINPMQAWEWGIAKAKTGVEVVRVGEFIDDKLTNVFQMTFHKIPYTNFTVGYLPRSVIPSAEVVEQINKEAKKKKAIFVKIEPYIMKHETWNLKHEKLQHANNEAIKQWNNVKKSPHSLFPEWTQMIDLTQTEDQLLAKMKPKTRYNIRIAQKHGVVVKEMTNNEGFNIFSKLYFDTCRRQNYKGHTPAYQKIIFEALNKDIAHILIAYYKDIPLVAYELFLFNNVLYYPYGGSSIEQKNLMPPNLLMWEVIKFGKKSGAKVFDMWGSLPPEHNPNDPWAGFTKFKQGYGTEFVQLVGSYDLILNKSLYLIYGFADKLRKKLLSPFAPTLRRGFGGILLPTKPCQTWRSVSIRNPERKLGGAS